MRVNVTWQFHVGDLLWLLMMAWVVVVRVMVAVRGVGSGGRGQHRFVMGRFSNPVVLSDPTQHTSTTTAAAQHSQCDTNTTTAVAQHSQCVECDVRGVGIGYTLSCSIRDGHGEHESKIRAWIPHLGQVLYRVLWCGTGGRGGDDGGQGKRGDRRRVVVAAAVVDIGVGVGVGVGSVDVGVGVGVGDVSSPSAPHTLQVLCSPLRVHNTQTL